jgi:YD repeat-containing protein
MQQRWLKGFGVWAAVTMLLCVSHTAIAQTTATFNPPDVDIVDPAGVSLISGNAQFPSAPVSIGPKESPLTFKELYQAFINFAPSNGMYGSVLGGNNFSAYPGGYVVVQVFDKSEVFWGDRSSTYQSWSQSGGILTLANGYVTQYTDRDGVQYNFSAVNNLQTCTDNTIINSSGIYEYPTYDPLCGQLTSVVYPDGTTLTLTDAGFNYFDLQNIAWVRSDGFAIHADYASYTSYGLTRNHLIDLKAANLAVDYCNMTQVSISSCTFSQTYPTASYIWTPAEITTVGATQTLTVTDQTSAVTTYTQGLFPSLPSGNMYEAVTTVKASTSASTVTSTYSTYPAFTCTADSGDQVWNCQTLRSALVSAATTGDGSWTYGYVEPGYPNDPIVDPNSQNWVTTATRSDLNISTAKYNTRTTFAQSVVTESGSLFYTNLIGAPNRITQAVDAEGRTFNFVYDNGASPGRGNITQKQQIGSDGSAGPTWNATYPPTCTYPVNCNKPTGIQDPNGNWTYYTYDPTHGGVRTETLPADSNGFTPQKRYSYVQLYALLKNSSGGYTPSAAPIWKLSSMSSCMTGNWNGTACVNAQGTQITNDLVTTTYQYGPTSGAANNLLVRGQTVTWGTTSHVTCYGYDALGNRTSVTTPNAGLTTCP